MSELIGSPFVAPELLNVPQLCFLGCVYAYVLCQASDTISNGSELLLLVPAFANVVGSVVLPVLGAVPDGVMVLVSGLGSNASEEIYVGVGTLAGSTVMLLTVAWYVSVLGGRVDVIKDPETGERELNYKKPAGVSSENFEKFTGKSIFDGAVGCKPTIKENCIYMLGTMLPVVLVQIAAFARNYYQDSGAISVAEGQEFQDYAVLVAFVLAFCGFAWYLYGQYQGSMENEVVEAKQVDAISTAIKMNTLTLDGALGAVARLTRAHKQSQLMSMPAPNVAGSGNKNDPLLVGGCAGSNRIASKDAITSEEQLYERLRKVLRPYFRKYDTNGDDKLDFEEFRVICSEYDTNGDDKLDFEEFRVICSEVSSSATSEAQRAIFKRMDSDGNGYLSFEEFIECMLTLTKKAQQYNIVKTSGAQMPQFSSTSESDMEVDAEVGGEGADAEASNSASEEEDSESDGDEDIPEELAHLSPEQQQTRIKIKAAWMCILGTILVVAFSDPMVDVFNELAVRTGVNPFFVSFILSPLVSNASELVAAYNYAKKKTIKSATISLSTLEGAACMNNTFCLGCFLFVLYFSHLEWKFTCEVATLIIAEVCVGYVAYTRNVHTMLLAHWILSLFPVCLVFVYVGTHVLGWT